MNDSPRRGTPEVAPDDLTRSEPAPGTASGAEEVAAAAHTEVTPPGMSATRRLLRALAVMSSGTMVSRLLGLVRVALAAFVIGTGTTQADTYAVAITVPTALYVLFAGGALNSVLVPQLTRAAKHDDDGGEAYTNRITTAFLLILLVVTVVVTLAAPWVTRIYSSDLWRTPQMADHYQAMVLLTMVCLPEVFFYGAFVILGQILNARDRFGPMMWAPVVSNIIQVAAFITFYAVWGQADGQTPFTIAQIGVLGGGYLVGAILQAGVLVFFLRRVGYRFRPRFDLKGTGLSKTFKLAGWAVGFVLVNQVALAVVSRLATSATADGTGAGLTVYNNAYLVFLLPHSLITVSLATAMVTSASKMAAAGDQAGTAAEVMRTMRLVTTALVPAAVLLIALGHPSARLLFGNGTGARDAPLIGWTIIAFAVGLVPFTIQHVCLRTYYALERNRDTFFIQLIIAAVQIALSLALVLPVHRPDWVAPMLALSLSVAYGVGLIVSFAHLRKFLPDLRAADIFRHVVRVTIAVIPGAVLAWWIGTRFDGSLGRTLLGLVLGGLVAGTGYLLLAHVFHITEITQIVTKVRRRRSPVAVAAGAGGGPADDPVEPVTDEASLETRVHPVVSPADELLPPTSVLYAPDLRSGAGGVAGGDTPGPAEGAGAEEDEGPDTAEDLHPIRAKAGQQLGGRYVLDEVVVRRSHTQTWLATDKVLSRQVVIHLLPPGEDDEQVLVAARRAAVATDSRFLRVLDAQTGDLVAQTWDPDADEPIGPYIVCEYAAGMSLEELLAAGPLSALESAWLVREVADALVGMHEQRLYHERINPGTVLITATGNVKIVGFLLESELTEVRNPLVPSADPERIDVTDLGRLLYCTLVSRWPGGHAYGMAAAPIDAEGHLLTPRQVRAGVSPALDTICDRILSPVPRQRERVLRKAHDVVVALNQVLGTANAAQDLERRLQYPVPVVTMDDEPETHLLPTDPATQDTAMGLPVAPLADPDAPTGEILAVDDRPTGTMASVPVTEAERQAYSAHALKAPHKDGPMRLAPFLIIMTLLVLIGALVAVALNQDRGAPVDPVALTITRATDFDPQGNDRQENPDAVPLAFDGDPDTAWTTVGYAQADMSNKDGVGVVFDLGEVREVSSVDLLLDGSPSSVALLVPHTEATVEAPLEQLGQWREIAAATGAGEQVTLTPAEPAATRFVFVMFTELPFDGTNFTGALAEVTFWGG